MSHAIRTARFAAALVLAVLTGAASPAHSGPFDRIKKAGQKATKEVERTIEDAGIEAGETAPETGEEKTGGTPAGENSAPAGGGAAEGGGASVSSVSTRFDFVPGDSLLFLDDFTQDELGEFPSRWRLVSGTFEIAEMKGERWLRCVSDDGHIRMKVPASLPEFWTLEFDAIGLDAGAYITIAGQNDKESTVWETMFPHSGRNLSFRCGEIFSTTALPSSEPVTGRHRMRYMARGTALKAYMNRERLASAPDVTGPGHPTQLDFRLWAPGKEVKLMITNVRFAEGCRPPKDMLAEGRLVTYGIHFDTGSDVVKPESAPVLRQIASYLESKPDVKLTITGHTDNVGSAASNLDLSKRRAAAVGAVLSKEFRLAADRFQSEGKGDTQPVSSNAGPEGRARNRRVEFTRFDAGSVAGKSAGR
jgi:OmpA-OmpF porin, OOP family